MFWLVACRSTTDCPKSVREPRQPPLRLEAEGFFERHYAFYNQNPSSFEALLTPTFFQALKRYYDNVTNAGQIGLLDRDPWLAAQEGEVSEPYEFKGIYKSDYKGLVKFEYTFANGPQGTCRQFVLMKFARTSKSGGWRFADLIMPNHKSLARLLAREP